MVDLVPVDHNPFAPSLVPVDHDPFAAQPVDYDPFASEKYVNPLVKGAIGSAADLIATPGRLANTPNPYPSGSEENQFFEDSRTKAGQDWARDAALATMGTGAIAGVPIKAGEAVMGAGPIRAYHGSPHDFNTFDINKIGTGEGAQAYGHGLYFAENEGIARGYRNKLADTPSTVKFYLDRAGGDPSKAANSYWQDVIRGPNLDAAAMEQAKQTASVIQSGGAGRMYKVDINADPAKMLDWDQPLQGQNVWERVHPNVREAIDEAMDNRMMNPMGDALEAYTGRDLHNALRHEDVHETLPGEIGNSSWYTGNTTEKRHTAEYLKSLEIPGIKYLDAGSRSAGDGSRNYVVFDHNLVDIVRKYALAGVALPPAIKAAYDQMQQGQPQASGQPDYMAGLRK